MIALAGVFGGVSGGGFLSLILYTHFYISFFHSSFLHAGLASYT